MYMVKNMENIKEKIKNLDLDKSELKLIQEWCNLNNITIERLYENKFYLNQFIEWNSKRISAFIGCHLYDDYMDSHIHMITQMGFYNC